MAEISQAGAVNVAAACSGGIVTAGLVGHLAASGDLGDVASLTLMVCALDNAEAGTVSALATRDLAAAAVAESARKGYLDGQALAGVFTWLRPNDLVWSYVVNNYLLGKEPPAFDILYWNQDTVRLAAGLHRDFVKHRAGELASPARARSRCWARRSTSAAVDVDVYAVAGLTDHIVPWENAYRSVQLFGGTQRFVLARSGHIQALVNPPARDGAETRSSYRVADEPPRRGRVRRPDAEAPGSWWPDWDRVAGGALRRDAPRAAQRSATGASAPRRRRREAMSTPTERSRRCADDCAGGGAGPWPRPAGSSSSPGCWSTRCCAGMSVPARRRPAGRADAGLPRRRPDAARARRLAPPHRLPALASADSSPTCECSDRAVERVERRLEHLHGATGGAWR